MLSFELPEEFRGVTCSSPQRLVQSGRDKVLAALHGATSWALDSLHYPRSSKAIL